MRDIIEYDYRYFTTQEIVLRVRAASNVENAIVLFYDGYRMVGGKCMHVSNSHHCYGHRIEKNTDIMKLVGDRVLPRRYIEEVTEHTYKQIVKKFKLLGL